MARVYQRMSNRAAKYAGTLVATPIWVEPKEAHHKLFQYQLLAYSVDRQAFNVACRDPAAHYYKRNACHSQRPTETEEGSGDQRRSLAGNREGRLCGDGLLSSRSHFWHSLTSCHYHAQPPRQMARAKPGRRTGSAVTRLVTEALDGRRTTPRCQ